MNTSYDVRIYTIRIRKDTKSNPYNVRWTVAREPFSEVFRTMGLAKGFHTTLTNATKEGEPFDVASGLPVRLARKAAEKAAQANVVTWVALAREYAEYKWSRLSANGRRSAIEVLRDITLFLLPSEAVREAGEREVNRALIHWVLNPGAWKVFEVARKSGDVSADQEVPAEYADAVRIVDKSSPSATELADLGVVRDLLDAFTWTRKDKRAAATYFARRRQVLHNVMAFGVKRKRLPRIALLDPELNWERPSDLVTDNTVDPRAVGAPAVVRSMLSAVSYVGVQQGHRFYAMFATMYHAMLRPEEAAMLSKPYCYLPEKGWGKLTISEAAPAAGRLWTDSGDVHDLRGLKHRSRDAVRVIPIAPELVRILRHHIDTFGVAPDGRLFRSVTNGYVHPSTTYRLWTQARALGLGQEEQATPLLRRPYDLRSSGVSARRTANVPAKQVAEWAGHSVEVLESIYSRVLDGYDERWQKQMDDFMNDSTATNEGDLRPEDGHGEPPEAA